MTDDAIREIHGPENPPAFPYNERSDDGSHWHSHSGMTLRDWFAGQALGKVKITAPVGADFNRTIAEAVWGLADAMLAEREKPKP